MFFWQQLYFIVFMKTLACGEGFHEEVNNGTAVPLKRPLTGPFQATRFTGGY